jgi:hypothetical protein
MKARPCVYDTCDIEEATHVHLLMHGHFTEQKIPLRKGDVRPSWIWNGSLESPTLNPSILTTCNGHCFVRAGVIEYLPDSTHEYAGKHMPLRDHDPCRQ